MLNRPSRLTVEFIKEQFAEFKIELLSKEYQRNSVPLQCRCLICNKEFLRTWNNFRQGSGCTDCGYKKRKQCQLRHTHKEVEILFIEAGLELLSPYRVKSDSLKYKCYCGHVSSTTLYNFLKGKRCPSCAKKASKNPAWDSDREAVRVRKLWRRRCSTLLSNTLRSSGQKKDSRTHQHLGYTKDQLKSHLESFPSWLEISKGAWEIDHVFPVKAFVDYGFKDLRLINCLQNLQPLKKRDNHRKKDKYDPDQFESWLLGLISAPYAE